MFIEDDAHLLPSEQIGDEDRHANDQGREAVRRRLQEIYAAFANDAKEMPTLFPDCSKTGAKTTAAPAIWERMDDFKAAIAKFADDMKAAQGNTKDLDALNANFQTIGKNCSNYRPTARRIVASLISAAWPFSFNHWATSRQIDELDR
jgi:phage-related protein